VFQSFVQARRFGLILLFAWKPFNSMEPEPADRDADAEWEESFKDIKSLKDLKQHPDFNDLQGNEDDIPKLMSYVLHSKPNFRESALRSLANLEKNGVDAPVAKFCAWVLDGVAIIGLFLLEVLTQIIETEDNHAMNCLTSSIANQTITKGSKSKGGTSASLSALNSMKVSVVSALATISSKENIHAIPAFSALLIDDDLQIRESAEKALLKTAEKGCQRTVTAVAKHLDHHQDPSVVELALSILLKIADDSNQAIIPVVRGVVLANDASAIGDTALTLLNKVGGNMQESSNTEDALADDEEEGGEKYCGVCEMMLNGPKQFKEHEGGKKHKKNEKRQQCLPCADSKKEATAEGQHLDSWSQPTHAAEEAMKNLGEASVDESFYCEKEDAWPDAWQNYKGLAERRQDWSQPIARPQAPPPPPLPTETPVRPQAPPPPPFPIESESLSRSQAEAARQRAMAKVMASKVRGSALILNSEGKELQAPPPPPLQAVQEVSAAKSERKPKEEKAVPSAKVKIKNQARGFPKELDDLAVAMLKVLQQFPQGLLLSQVKPQLCKICDMQFSAAIFGCDKLHEVFRFPPLDKMFPMEIVPDRNEIKLKTPAPHTIPDHVKRRVEGSVVASASASSGKKVKGHGKGQPKIWQWQAKANEESMESAW
jgi:hypothetical protein